MHYRNNRYLIHETFPIKLRLHITSADFVEFEKKQGIYNTGKFKIGVLNLDK